MARPSGVNMVPRVAEFTKLLSTLLLSNFFCQKICPATFFNMPSFCGAHFHTHLKSLSWNHSQKSPSYVVKLQKDFYMWKFWQKQSAIKTEDSSLCSEAPSLVFVAKPIFLRILLDDLGSCFFLQIFWISHLKWYFATASVKNMFTTHLQVPVIFVGNCMIHNRLPWYL